MLTLYDASKLIWRDVNIEQKEQIILIIYYINYIVLLLLYLKKYLNDIWHTYIRLDIYSYFVIYDYILQTYKLIMTF